ncbi:MAG TPA: bifunctional YncE family protein/alkaline phosphatase family protein [Vicinamibacterales bacterium]|nr:bifunctional YncE family protein/alkaline phosphatase family protein [Vicinamibacterales bacterium]
MVFAATWSTWAQHGAAPPLKPGYEGRGVTLLPNGWRIAPEGRHILVGDLPMNLVPSPDGRFIAISTSGWAKPAISIFDTHTLQLVSRADVEHSWFGLVWHPDGKRLYASGASENVIYGYTFDGGRLKAAGSISLGPAEVHPGRDVIENAGYVAGMSISADGRRLYAAQMYGQKIRVIDIAQKQIVATAELSAEPYTCVLSPDGQTLFVSIWGGAKVLMLDPATLTAKGDIAVGEHPNAMAVSHDGARVFVACANTNAVWVVDVGAKTAAEQISVALGTQAPAGSTPNGVALSPDGHTLLIANADNNTITVADVSKPGASTVLGWIPVGWYPTNVLFDRDGSRFFVLDGKGLTGLANPRGPQPGGARLEAQYSGAMFQGDISVIPTPGAAALARMTARVRALTPYSDATRLAPADAPAASPIPRRVGGSSPIKYVFYVIRENRTYDQVLGDLPKANGDPSLTLFGEAVTPNAHALATVFATFDNFYVDAEVSYDGHAFSTGAYATDFVEKMWPANYGRREGLYLSEGGYKMRTPFGNIAAPAQGYLWDAAKRANVSFRSYGEFSGWERPDGEIVASVPGLDGHVNTKYPPFDLSIPDMKRVEIWTEEFKELERTGTMPRLSIVRLGGDHTNGASPGALTPRAFVAENDLALGQFVETLSHSSIWKESAIFVLEDDAQNGPDHVDAHRSILLAISPFLRRGVVDSTLYTTCGVLRTMELILGLPPMSQYDAAATPMYNAFSATPSLAPFTHVAARVPLTDRNDWATPGAAASQRMDFSAPDLAPDLELNQIIWATVRGRDSVMPPPRRSGFIRPIAAGDDDRD